MGGYRPAADQSQAAERGAGVSSQPLDFHMNPDQMKLYFFQGYVKLIQREMCKQFEFILINVNEKTLGGDEGVEDET